VRGHIVYGTANLRQQIAEADVVARARIVDAAGAVVLEDPPLRRPVVDAALLEVLKGDAESGPVRFAQHGHGVAEFVDGEEVLLFLRRIERIAELDDPRLAAAVRYVSLQEHDARYPLAGESGERFVAAARAYLAVEAIQDPAARLEAQRQVTLEMLLSDDPRLADDAELLSAVRHTDEILDALWQRSTTGALGSGGVATKVSAARMAAWSGIPTVIADASSTAAVAAAVAGDEVGTWVEPHEARLTARKLWIAFGLPAQGKLVVDAGAARALLGRGGSLLAAGILVVAGEFEAGAAVEVVGPNNKFIGKGLVGLPAEDLRAALGQHSTVTGGAVVHRDDLVVLAR